MYMYHSSSDNLFCKNRCSTHILYNAMCATYMHHSSVVTSSVSTSVPANNPNPALNRLTRRVTTRPQTLIINHKLQIERLRWANNMLSLPRSNFNLFTVAQLGQKCQAL